ncbi:Protein CBG17224 [Caenorhabditis briggsae]|uniref:Protein CBG17224 n=1 Tax=Caenorhabditis briggsae TaxID=6238 RepID=A8XQJ0_CAEBR|nr:Protein CBG17224 [Caenorhabditis briggsae]CAP34915.2 Protein CBG17224 [Caenorhabditis briggsae]
MYFNILLVMSDQLMNNLSMFSNFISCVVHTDCTVLGFKLLCLQLHETSGSGFRFIESSISIVFETSLRSTGSQDLQIAVLKVIEFVVADFCCCRFFEQSSRNRLLESRRSALRVLLSIVQLVVVASFGFEVRIFLVSM